MKTVEIQTGGEKGTKLIRADVVSTAQEALNLMKEHRIHHLLVFDGPAYMGVVGDREVIHRSASTPLGEIVKRNQSTIDENSDVSDALRVIVENGLDAVVVLRSGKISGIVTTTDMLRVLHGVHKHSGMQNLVSQGEALLSSPMVQNFLNALSSVGV
jgi:CBS domain-containing protein